jgi:hypothetical protein
MWKQAVVVYSRYHPDIYLDYMRNTTKHIRLVGVPTKTGTKNQVYSNPCKHSGCYIYHLL